MVALLPAAASAYVGPGAGISLLGSLWGLILALLFVFFGLFLLPFKLYRSRAKRRAEAIKQAEEKDSVSSDAAEEPPEL